MFWHDNWTSLGPLIKLTSPNGPQNAGIPSNATISQSVLDGIWALPRGRHPTLALLRACLPDFPPDLSSNEPDYFLWRHKHDDERGMFLNSKTWLSLQTQSPHVLWYKSVWFGKWIPKHAFLLWVITHV